MAPAGNGLRWVTSSEVETPTPGTFPGGCLGPALQAQLADPTAELAGDLVLDIAGLAFVDSTGLALFVLLHKRLANTGHERCLGSLL